VHLQRGGENWEWWIDWLFTVLSHSQEFFTYMETSLHAGEGLHIAGICSALRTYRLWAGKDLYRATTAISNGPLVLHVKYRTFPLNNSWIRLWGLCSALRAFEQGGIFAAPDLLWHGSSVFPISSEGPRHSDAFYDINGDIDWLFTVLRPAQEFFTYMKTSITICRWRTATFRTMLGAQGLWAGRDRYRSTPTVTRGLGFSGLIRRTAPLSRLLRHARGMEDPF
jgi:hypothetical protein